LREVVWIGNSPFFALCSTNLVIILGVMQLAKKIPFENPMILNACRAAYIISNLIILGISLYIKAVVDKKKGTLRLRP
jgi:Phosphate transport (Pho88)